MLTIEEHLQFIARAYQLKDWERDAARLLERMELGDKRKKLGKELSKGMQQKLSICCALLPRPSVLLFDEPLVGLDPHAIQELKEMLEELRGEECSILISTHILDRVEVFLDKALIMVKGRTAAERTREQVRRTGENLKDLFFEVTEGAAHSGKDGTAL